MAERNTADGLTGKSGAGQGAGCMRVDAPATGPDMTPAEIEQRGAGQDKRAAEPLHVQRQRTLPHWSGVVSIGDAAGDIPGNADATGPVTEGRR